jgi:Cu2+-exporting ATPase
MAVHEVVVADADRSDSDGGEPTDPDAVLARAAALERYSAHPIAEAVTEAAAADPADPDAVETHDRGVTGEIAVDGAETTVVVGHPDLLADRGLALPADLREAADSARAEGNVPVAVGWGDRARGVVVVGDRPREGWREAVADLAEGREVVVLTGDDERAAEQFRADPNVAEVFAGVPPEAKAETVERLKSRGTVAMVGDGSNDAPALATADIGVALGSGTDLAGDAADAVVVDGGLAAVADVFRVARGTNRRIKQNLGWAFLYNAVAVPLAVLGLLNPLFAAVAMGTSSLLVVANSSRSLE